MNTITLFKIIIFISALTSTVLTGYVYQKRGNSSSIKYLSGLLLANVLYASSYFLEISATNLAQVKFFLYLEYVGIFFIPLFWIFIAFSYHPDNPSYNQNLLIKLRVMYLIPLIASVLVWTNDWHHLIYHDINLDYIVPIAMIRVERAMGFWIINGIIILLFLVGAIRMVFNLINSKGSYRKQYLLLSLASLPPLISYILILNQTTPYGLDLNPITFALSGLLLFWGMDNLQLFNILPIAQKLVIDAMGDAMIVLDAKGRLIESNTPAKILFEYNTDIFTLPLTKVNPHLSPLFSHPLDTFEIDIILPKTNEIRTFSIYRSPIRDRKHFTRGHLYLLHDLTKIKNYVKELEYLASRDGLTNLLNHRHFMSLAHEEATRLQEQGFGEFSLIMFDLDYFKVINDTYGHSYGDKILQQIGALVPQQVRPNDLCARYGGEEFVILLYDTSIDQATSYAEKLRSAIAKTKFISNEKGLNITVSFGVSTYSPTYNYSWEITLNQADTALYMAKHAGRNVVKSFQE